MPDNIHIETAEAGSAPEIVRMVGELLEEIMESTGAALFRFDRERSSVRLKEAIERGTYVVFVARVGSRAAGFVTLYESFALYAEGAFGTIAEFYVRPQYRSGGVGRRLLRQVKACARGNGWRRLEVTTPPLPAFDRTLAFYEREGFGIAGGRKMKMAL